MRRQRLEFHALKIVVAVIGLIAVAVFVLGPSLGLNIDLENLLRILANAMVAVITFLSCMHLSKILEGLLS